MHPKVESCLEVAGRLASRVPPMDRDDVEQEILVQMLRRAGAGTDPGPDRGLLFLIGKNVLWRYFKWGAIEGRNYQSTPGPRGDEGNEIMGSVPDPEGMEDVVISKVLVEEALTAMPVRMAQIARRTQAGFPLDEKDRRYRQRWREKLQMRVYQILELGGDTMQPGRHFLLQVQDDSMIEDRVQAGDRLVVDRFPEEFNDGDMAVVSIIGSACSPVVRRFYNRWGGWVLLKAAHPEYPPESYFADQVQVLGRVVGGTFHL